MRKFQEKAFYLLLYFWRSDEGLGMAWRIGLLDDVFGYLGCLSWGNGVGIIAVAICGGAASLPLAVVAIMACDVMFFAAAGHVHRMCLLEFGCMHH